jgi:hypothetical protein
METDRWTRGVTWILIAVACGAALPRILTCRSPDRNVPFFSANDRSRWCTIRALVDKGTFAIDGEPGDARKGWYTIDQVRHVGPDGKMHFYSSKPPLWPTLLAGQYWLIQKGFGWTLDENAFEVVRLMLIVNNLVGLGLLIWFVGRIAEFATEQAWARCFVAAAAALGTYLGPFAATLNNHLPAAAVVAITLWLCVKLLRARVGWGHFFCLGLLAAFAATLEFPATSWLAVCALISIGRSMVKSLCGFFPGVVLVASAFFGVNYWAHGDWRPAYDHRADGESVASLSGDFEPELDAGSLAGEFVEALNGSDLPLGFAVEVGSPVIKRTGAMVPSPLPQWIVNEDRATQFIIERREPGSFVVRKWANWYDYPGSYWRSDNVRMSDIDRGEPDQLKYLAHMTIGHHGVVSLTPVFVLSLLGIAPLCFGRRFGFRLIAFASLGVTLAVFYFYATRPEIDRNYGGMTSALRWVFWLYPFWLIWMVPALERAGRRAMGVLCCAVLLALSVASAGYVAGNPWVLPWLSECFSRWGFPV